MRYRVCNLLQVKEVKTVWMVEGKYIFQWKPMMALAN